MSDYFLNDPTLFLHYFNHSSLHIQTNIWPEQYPMAIGPVAHSPVYRRKLFPCVHLTGVFVYGDALESNKWTITLLNMTGSVMAESCA